MTSPAGPTVAVIGAGMGGLTAAAALRRAGIDAHVFEQAPAFARVGAGIQISPNAFRALESFGVGPALRRIGVAPVALCNRTWDTDELLNEVPGGDAAERRYGVPYLLAHRADLHAVLVSMVSPEALHLNKRLADLRPTPDGVELAFADGSAFRADVVVGADGIHSRVHELLFDTPAPHFSGRVAYRSVFPAARVPFPLSDKASKWWGEDRHIVIYAINGGDEVYFVTSLPEDAPPGESWSAKGDMAELRRAYAAFPDTVRGVLDACPESWRWGIYVRNPLPRWTDGPIALLGDACHPMTPYMAQGAAMAMEDAVVLARCLDGGDPAAGLRRYERTRRERADRVQTTSAVNPVMGRTDLDWLYGYDAWTTPLDQADATSPASQLTA